MVSLAIWAGPSGAITQTCGPTWTIVPSPNRGTTASSLAAVTAISPTDAWAVGHSLPATLKSKTFTEHWDGTSWTLSSTPNIGPHITTFSGIDADSSGNVWAVGYWYNAHNTQQTLVEQYCPS